MCKQTRIREHTDTHKKILACQPTATAMEQSRINLECVCVPCATAAAAAASHRLCRHNRKKIILCLCFKCKVFQLHCARALFVLRGVLVVNATLKNITRAHPANPPANGCKHVRARACMFVCDAFRKCAMHAGTHACTRVQFPKKNNKAECADCSRHLA